MRTWYCIEQQSLYRQKLNENNNIKTQVEKETSKIASAFSKMKQNEEHHREVTMEYDKLKDKYKVLNRHHMMMKSQFKSLLSTFINLFEFLLFHPSGKHNVNTEEQNHMLQQIKEGLTQKLQSITLAFSDVELNCEILQVKSWKFHSTKFQQNKDSPLHNKTRNAMIDTQASSNFTTIILNEETTKEEEGRLQSEIMKRPLPLKNEIQNYVCGKALYKFTSERPQDLAFEAGETVYIEMIKNGGWWIGFMNGRRGFFPYNYIKLSYGLIVRLD